MSSTTTPVQLIDPRGPRFGAVITSSVLALVLLLEGVAPVVSIALLAVQTLAFAAGALLGLQHQPYGVLFRRVVRPRLAPPADLEDARPPRFAQGVGLVFALAGLTGALLGLTWLFLGAVALALVAALLNAVFDFCLGCELYLVGKRLLARADAVGAEG